MPIDITSIPSHLRKPGNYMAFKTDGARSGAPVVADKLLIIAQQSSAATATADEPVQVFSAAQAQTLFGAGSPAALMCKAVLEENPYVAELWVCPVDEDGAGVAASGTMQFTAVSVTAGTLLIKIGRHIVTVGVAADDTSNDIAAAVEAAIDADTSLPFSASVSTDTVTLTAKVKGTHGNSWVWASEFSGSGLTVAIVQPTSGATDGDTAGAFTAVENTQYDLIAVEVSSSANLTALSDHLESVGGPLEQRPGLGFAGMTGTLSTVTTATAAVNDGSIGVAYMRGTRTHPMELAAAYAALFSAEPDRARPLNNVRMKVAIAPDAASDYLTRAEQESCLANGCTPLEVGVSDTVRVVRSISTYVQNDAGSDDDTLIDLQTMRVLNYYRYAVRVKLEEELAQVKIASKAVTPNTTDPDKIKSLLVGVAMTLQTELGYLQEIEDNLDRFVVEEHPSVAGRVQATIPAPSVSGLHIFAGEFQLIL